MSRPRPGRIRFFVAELRRRRVFRVAGIYLVAAFAAFQGASVLVPALHLPDWTMTLLVVLVIVGSPVVLALAWAFDIVPGGVQRTPSAAGDAIGSTTGAAPAASGGGAPLHAGALHDGGVAATTTDSDLASPAPVAAIEPAWPTLSGAAATPPRPARPSVAVVPFLNMSADPDNEYFADGITEDVIAHLSKVGALKVISRTSVMPFKKRGESLRAIGAKLGATAVVDGSVRRVGDRVRIVAQLVDVQTDQHLWADTYDRELTDIFSIQTDVAVQIAAALEAELSPEEQTRIRKEPTTDLQAYELYLKGRHWFIRYTPDALNRAIDYFTRAVAVDPRYALAHTSIAMAYAELAETGGVEGEVARQKATNAALEALRIDPGLGEAHCTLAHLKLLWEFDWAGAEAGFRRALELCPNNADACDLFGRMYAALGRFDEALALQRRAQELDPLAHRLDVATTLLRAGRWEEAAGEAFKALEFDPDHDRAHATLGWAYFKQGRTEDGLRQLERATALSPENTQWLAQLGEALALAGRTDESREILRQLQARAAESFVTPYHLAFVYTGLGEHERALDLLERAFEERGGAIYGIKGSFLLAPLRPYPRFQALLARMNVH